MKMRSQYKSKETEQQSHNLIAHTNKPSSISLRSIQKSDTFPCYSCFDTPQMRQTCKVCNQLGFIYGDHPMVLFVDDFLNKNLGPHLESKIEEAGNESKKSQASSQISDDQKILFLNKRSLVNRAQCRSAISSYGSEYQAPTKQQSSKMMKSAVPNAQAKDFVHNGFQCNGCGCLPIRGKRFHCTDCEDYDLCQKCYTGKVQTDDHSAEHIMNQIKRVELDQIMKLVANKKCKKTNN